MSDEHAADSDGADDAESGDSLEPGGGPQRVVSEESVDDILASLDETKSESADSSDTTATTDESDAVTTTFDEDDVPAADETTGDASQPDTGAATETATVARTAADSEPDADAADDSDDTDDTGDTDTPSEPDTTADDATTVDAAASSLPDDASLEELAARVEDGTVTGADVRAAEAGDGRESTPEIDEVDLSLDDLETSGVSDTGSGPDVPNDAGPLAGSVDRDSQPNANDNGDDGDSDDSPGLLGRLKNLFSL
ncbi:hypothetical protein [Natrinema sp. HArc-T2]|uniref:hypothetical protein n=1 Tax=Natrinema sp. HArc-T2 TaxID=3242701 RepID=UPI00359E0966